MGVHSIAVFAAHALRGTVHAILMTYHTIEQLHNYCALYGGLHHCKPKCVWSQPFSAYCVGPLKLYPKLTGPEHATDKVQKPAENA